MPKKLGNLTLYSVDDLHEMLGVSKLTLRSYIRNGKIRGRKLGVSWYVTEDSIREYFDQSTQIEEPSKKLNVKYICLLYTSPSPRDRTRSRMPSSA